MSNHYPAGIAGMRSAAARLETVAVQARAIADALEAQADAHGARYRASESPTIDAARFVGNLAHDLARIQETATDALASIARAALEERDQ